MKHAISIMKEAMRAISKQKAIIRNVYLLWLLTLGYYIVRMLNPLLQSALLDGTATLFNDVPDYSLLLIGFVGILLSEGFLALQNAKWGILFTRTGNEIQIGIQSKIFDKLCRIPYSAFNTPKIYENIELVSGNYARYCSNFLAGRTLSSLIGTFISFVFTSSVLINIDPVIAGIVVCGNLFGVFKTWLEAHLNYYSTVEKMKERRYANAYNSPLFDRNTIKEVKVFGLMDYIIRKWLVHTNKVNRKTMAYNSTFLLLDFVTYFIANAFTIAALILTARMILAGETSIGTFVLVYSSSGSLIDTSGSLFGALGQLKMASFYHTAYQEFMAMPDIEKDINSIDSKDKTDAPLDIVIEHLNYTYDGSDTKAIDDLSLTIRQGEKIAIVGENGCGKTTLVALLNRLYSPDSGAIFLGGKPQEEQLSLLRRHVSTVFQNYGTYETSFRENIIMSDLEQCYSDEDIMACAGKTGLDKRIQDSAAGLHTPIGRFAEGGINLSGGEWQKLAITRGLIRKSTKVLIMDEPNAALDPVAETTIYKQVFDAIQDQTLILITHRLGAIKYVDRIIVMDHGQIVEDGSHNDLMLKRGKYYDMYTAQAKWYD